MVNVAVRSAQQVQDFRCCCALPSPIAKFTSKPSDLCLFDCSGRTDWGLQRIATFRVRRLSTRSFDLFTACSGALLHRDRRRRTTRTVSLKAKCGSPRFDPLVHHARSCDDNSVQEVGLTVTTALNARRAGPDCSASRHEIVDEFRERFEWIDLSGVGSALSHKIDATAAQKDENL